MGFCDHVDVIEIGGDRVTVFRQGADPVLARIDARGVAPVRISLCVHAHRADGEDSAMATIVIRGATTNMMDDLERAIDDAVNVVKAVVRVRPSASCAHPNLLFLHARVR